MNSTITDQMDHTEKPICSATTDQIRLRRAMFLLPASQAATSSGSQSVMRFDMRPTLERLYCAKAPRDNPAVNFRSRSFRACCEFPSTSIDTVSVHDGERQVYPIALE